MCKRRISVVIPFVSKFSFSALEMASDAWCSFFCVDPQWHESHGSSLDQVVVGEEVARLCLFDDCDVRCYAPAGNPLSVVSQIIVSSSCQFGSCTSLLRHQPQIWKSTAEISTGSSRVPVPGSSTYEPWFLAPRAYPLTR